MRLAQSSAPETKHTLVGFPDSWHAVHLHQTREFHLLSQLCRLPAPPPLPSTPLSHQALDQYVNFTEQREELHRRRQEILQGGQYLRGVCRATEWERACRAGKGSPRKQHAVRCPMPFDSERLIVARYRLVCLYAI